MGIGMIPCPGLTLVTARWLLVINAAVVPSLVGLSPPAGCPGPDVRVPADRVDRWRELCGGRVGVVPGGRGNAVSGRRQGAGRSDRGPQGPGGSGIDGRPCVLLGLFWIQIGLFGTGLLQCRMSDKQQ